VNIYKLELGINVLEDLRTLPNEVLLVVPVGSRAYGTATDQSDYDYAAITIPTPRQLALQETVSIPKLRYDKDGTPKPRGTNSPDKPGDVSIEIITLSELVSQFIRGTPMGVEIMSYMKSQKEDELDKRFTRQIAVLEFLNRLGQVSGAIDIFPLKSFAQKNVRFIEDKARRLKTYRVLKEWVLSRYKLGCQKNEQFEKVHFEDFKKTQGTLIGIEIDPVDGVCLFGKSFSKRLTLGDFEAFVEARLNAYGSRAIKADDLGYDLKSLGHALRCVIQIREILLSGYIKYPLREAQLLIDVKNEKFSHEEVKTLFLNRYAETERLLDSIPNFQGMLSEARDAAYNFVSENMLAFYRRLYQE
jgi:predicted nucleotidyltransferase